MAKEKPVIDVSTNGHYVIKNLDDIENSKREKLDSREIMILCRCGGSEAKPFCDGTHGKIGFDQKKSPKRVPDKVDDYEGKEVTINDNRGVCSHAAYCSNGLPSVWTFGKEPWIDPDGADGEKIIKQIKKCPSGALSYTLKGERYQNLEREPKIIVSKNGPYYIQGSIKLADNIGSKPEAEEHFSLCRCGASKNKPFCDGSHWKIKFNDLKN
ncbi:CDGSH iron-sulfur domain-containing protein [Candidatus Woesearchaeota archaeon]|nr:CDGSH iron-sulfur domain-containing protein [Candidatus Woesearchaeota archaeon]